MSSCKIPVQMLGQSGCKLSFGKTVVYFDPYLSNSVQLLDSEDLERLIPVPVQPESIKDADIVLVSHDHIDHCDPHTLPVLAQASPKARFFGPAKVLKKLKEWGIAESRLFLVSQRWIELAPGLKVRAIPSAHPNIVPDSNGSWETIGFLLDYANHKTYLSGDTRVEQQIIDTLIEEGPIHTAFLPVNEHNFFKERRGILGNMSPREAFQFAEEIGVRQVVAVHWDMFAINSVAPEEIRLVYQKMNPAFQLLIQPSFINFNNFTASVVIRTLNEAKYLDELLTTIANQKTVDLDIEVVLVDSGSTDDTLKIAKKHKCNIIRIKREEFSFGRSLNIGCKLSVGEFIVIISGHCVPKHENWLQDLCQPLIDGVAEYTYGRQLAGPASKFSEERIFAKYFPSQSKIPQEGFYCNNANSAILKSTWENYRFDEELTGLEDMELAQRLVNNGGKVAYVAEASVYHHHAETWNQVSRRFEREAIALQQIMPQVHVSLLDMIRYIISSVQKDLIYSKKYRVSTSFKEVIYYRWSQYFGAYKGNKNTKLISRLEKERYFYPD